MHLNPDVADRADARALAPLLNCLLREVAEPLREPGADPTGPDGERRVYRLGGTGRLLR
ncbi:IucA/IucC family siderophore biosynthesis protein, partial [Streptomyces sp. Lzd4kr]|nr:IucA/IucC family siderophore biosynthesis protein [Streptomyces sp. Lzd4kr]